MAASTLYPGVIGWGVGLLGGLLVGVASNLVPELIVKRLAAKRVWRIQSALPDAMDLLIVCLEAGTDVRARAATHRQRSQGISARARRRVGPGKSRHAYPRIESRGKRSAGSRNVWTYSL